MSRKPHTRALFQSDMSDAQLIEQMCKDHYMEVLLSRHRSAAQLGFYRQAGVSGDITKADTQNYLRRQILREHEGLLDAFSRLPTI